jgi:hypothetical protein
MTQIGNQNNTKPTYMELISEEELSVCRSEGSPPKKKRRTGDQTIKATKPKPETK